MTWKRLFNYTNIVIIGRGPDHVFRRQSTLRSNKGCEEAEEAGCPQIGKELKVSKWAIQQLKGSKSLVHVPEIAWVPARLNIIIDCRAFSLQRLFDWNLHFKFYLSKSKNQV